MNPNEMKRRPICSAIFSMMAPGLGQLYNGQLIKGLVFYFLWLSVNFLIPLFNVPLTFRVILVFMMLSLALSLISIIDSVICSIKIKKCLLRKYNRWTVYLPVILATIFILHVFPKASYLRGKSLMVPTESMAPTLFQGDFVIADLNCFKSKDPKPGDVILIYPPNDPTNLWIKRCIAAAGQTVEIIDKRVYIDGIQFSDSSYVQFIDSRIETRDGGMSKQYIYNYLGSRDNFGPMKIPENHYFVLGDNRDNSQDSRYIGPISRENVTGKALFVYFSIDKHRRSFFDKIRWSRIGKGIQ